MNSDEGKEPRRRRECSRERHAAESSEQREARLAKLRERCAAESSELEGGIIRQRKLGLAEHWRERRASKTAEHD